MTPLAALALEALPSIAGYLFGSRGEAIGRSVESVVEAVTGTSDPDQARSIIEADPGKLSELRVQLAKIYAEAQAKERDADIEAMKVELSNMLSARQMAQGSGVVGRGALLVTCVILFLFTFQVVGAGFGLQATEPMTRILEYSLIAVLGFWLGSSSGSHAKSGTIPSGAPSLPFEDEKGRPR